ncbi:hypothetical protein [Maricaulis sp.]|uniref:hypothetical protein n=1 Tax=Maricaulis sp. TaxID=1486257 RepID=UPI0025C00BA9|nr:hypothetical protein [Maricaulis sp.]
MSFETHYHSDAQYYETRIRDRIDADGVIALDRSILESPHWDGGRPRLVMVDYNVDLAEIDMAVLAERILPHLEETRGRRTRRERIAWVVPNDLSRSIVDVWELMPDKDGLQAFRSFRTREEAMDWLLDADSES